MTTKYINFTEEFEKDIQDELRLKEQSSAHSLTTRTYMKILRLMLHGQLKDSSRPDDKNKKGCVIAFESKKDLHARRGKIITNLQQLVKFNPTHFTQGSYPDFKLHMDKKGVVSGFVKDNLNQLNFSVVDIDSKKKSVDEIVDCARLHGLFPTLVLETDRGYQTYFVFSEALYLNGKTYKWILRSAELVNDNLKKMYQKYGFDVDTGCTTYQICRFPQRNRVRFFDLDNVMTYDQYAQWSLKTSEYNRLPRKGGKQSDNNNNGNFTIVKGNLPGWARALRGFSGFKQGDRNTCLYTVSLSYRDAGIPVEQAIEELVPWMVSMGLKKPDVKRTIESAYKGGKHASKTFFEPLLQEYNLEADHVSTVDWKKLTTNQLKRFWVHRKPAKSREERVRSHLHEYVDDVLKMTQKQTFTGTKSDLMRELGLKKGNSRMINKILKELEEREDVEIKTLKEGRQAQFIIQKVAEVRNTTESKPVEEKTKEAVEEEQLREEVAVSLIGSPQNREYARVRVVTAIGTRRYNELVVAFIEDAAKFVGGQDRLDQIRNYNNKKASG